jgi:ABC-type branched-subunit amino acid transport system ATPase component/ABC-type branched-subunit amino acid transport system permease subunit
VSAAAATALPAAHAFGGSVAVDIAGMEVTVGRIALGTFGGLTYGLLAAGLVLVYRSSRFINFAHGAIGVFGAAFLSLAVNEYGVPYWPAFLLGLLVAAGVGVVTEAAVVRPLQGAPKVLAMVVTLGLSTFLIVTALAVNPDGLAGLGFPKPTGMPTFSLDATQVTEARSAQMILAPILLIGLGWFLRSSRLGLAIRAAAVNPRAAATAGVSPQSASRAAWAIAGAIAAFAASLTIPTRGTVTPETFGPELLLRGLAAAAIAQFRSIPLAAAAAVAIGIVEQLMASNSDYGGLIEVVILAAVIVSLLLDRRRGREAPEPWSRLAGRATLPDSHRRVPLIRHGGIILSVVCFAAACIIPVVASASQSLQATVVIAVAIVGLSVGIVTGLGGQLSLAQFGFAAIGAATSVKVMDALGDQPGSVPGFIVGLLAGALAAGVVAVLLAIPALRVRGPQLGVATLSFSLVTSAYLLDRNWLLGERPQARRPDVSVNGLSTAGSRGYVWVALAALAVAMLLVRGIRRSAWALGLEAVRDNEDAARAMTIRSTQRKLQAALLGGIVAGVGGVIYGHAQSTLAAADYPITRSIEAITVAVIGGLNSVAGPVIGAVYLIGIQSFFSPTTEALAGIAGAWLILVVYQWGGVAGAAAPVVRKLQDSLARRAGVIDDEAGGLADTAAATTATTAPATAAATDVRSSVGQPIAESASADPTPTLQLTGVSRRFGGVVAVDAVDLTVTGGELVGLIGPNGAGKTTLFEIISGFTRPSSGSVTWGASNITTLASHERARRGIARSFQSATLFPTLTVTETVMVAHERHHGGGLATILAADGGLRRRRQQAVELVDQFGLADHRDTVIASLPTGLRRLTELACAVALQPQLLLLDEPSAGISQADTESLGRVLADLHARTGMTMIVIEHDLPLLAELCTRLVAMETGKVIADGTPAEVQANELVVASYIG